MVMKETDKKVEDLGKLLATKPLEEGADDEMLVCIYNSVNATL